MESSKIILHKALDAIDSYAISLEGDHRGNWRARTGFGQDYEKVWNVELQSEEHPVISTVDWELVLERAVQAYQLSDPVITNFHWPQAA